MSQVFEEVRYIARNNFGQYFTVAGDESAAYVLPVVEQASTFSTIAELLDSLAKYNMSRLQIMRSVIRTTVTTVDEADIIEERRRIALSKLTKDEIKLLGLET